MKLVKFQTVQQVVCNTLTALIGKNFVNVVQCTTATCDYPTTAKALYQLNDNPNDTCGNYNGVETDITYAAGQYGKAAVFNGSSSKITTSGKPMGSSDTLSISFWA